MPPADRATIEHYIEARDATGLAKHLRTDSNLPGPRGNLEVASAVAEALRTADVGWVIGMIEVWSALGPEDAGGNEPGVMLPFTAAQAAGALWTRAIPTQQSQLDRILHRAANDYRWRVREGAAMGFQRIGFDDFDGLCSLVDEWEPQATLLEHRAIVAGLAEPPLLTNSARAAFGMHCAVTALDALLALPPGDRRSEGARALRKALGYVLSVFIAADPAGFVGLECLAGIDDKDAAWIVRENLNKARIAKRYPDECARIASMVDA